MIKARTAITGRIDIVGMQNCDMPFCGLRVSPYGNNRITIIMCCQEFLCYTKQMEDKPASENIQQHPNRESPSAPKAPNTETGQNTQKESAASTQSQITKLEDQIRSAEKWMIWLTAAIAFFGLCTVIVGTLQWIVMGGQLREMKSGGTDTHALAESALAQAQATNRLASEAKRSADLAQSQQIPWLGIEQPDSMPVKFSYLWRAPLPHPTVNVDVRFSAKNYGTSPAHLVPYQISTLILDITPENDSKSLRKTCGIEAYRTPGQVTLPQDPGEVLVPGANRPFNYGVVTNFGANTPKEFKTLSFTACLLYQDATHAWHFSGYRYKATGVQTVQVPGHSGWSYVQFVQGSLLASDAE